MKSQPVLKYLWSLNSSLEMTVENSTLYCSAAVILFVRDFNLIVSDQ